MPRRVLVVDDSTTVCKIVRLVLEDAGYEVVDAADGQQALDLVQREAFDLCLVDFVMPRLNGYQFAQAVRSIAHLRALPLVLMSAKADQIGERFMKQTGAVDAITKPFPPDAILAVVAHALERREVRGPEPTLVNQDLEVEADATSASIDISGLQAALHDASVLEGYEPQHKTDRNPFTEMTSTAPDMSGVLPLVLAQAGAALHFAEVVARAVTPALTQLARQGNAPDERAIADAITRALPPAQLAQIAREVQPLADELRGPVVLEGSVSQVPMGEVLQLLRLQRQTGLFVVQHRNQEVAVAFRDGNIDLAVARNVSSEFLLGRYLMADQLITREELDAVLARRTPGSGWLGEQLVREGYLQPDDLTRVLTRQCAEVIYEVLRWPDGRYRFEAKVVVPEAQGAALGLPVEALVLEGFRRVDEWRVIEQEVSSFDEVLARNEEKIEMTGAQRLSREEQRVLDAIDGRRSVREVISAAAMNSFDGCRILYRLLRSQLVWRRAA